MAKEISTFMLICIKISLDEPDKIMESMMADKVCPMHVGLRSGAPLIGLGIILLLSAGISYLGQGPAMFPIVVIFGGAGIFMIWAGITK